ncbi:hypothetical protein [Sphingobacterium sp. SGL-16]|uniref:hypothetical protein n=1 Tax=Sphingobacterium sp. SGL-16 TaxID=2710883 RepID=UPI0013EB49A8|nr:hypothetical protein [Sphingobacterium sp. SGL-16]NGM71879.1 hypothetical protein [Sphingobacterium sp. SGL-16]
MKGFDKFKLLNKTNRELELYINEPEKYESEAVASAYAVLLERKYVFTDEHKWNINSLINHNNIENLKILEEQKLITDNIKLINTLTLILYLLTALSVIYLVYTFYDKQLLDSLNPILFIPSIIIFITAILIRLKFKYRYLIPGLIIPIIANYASSSYFENVDYLSNVLFLLQLIIWGVANLILFLYKKSPKRITNDKL